MNVNLRADTMQNKNRSAFYLLIVLLFISCHSVMMAMIPSSSRRILGPAMQSGFRSMSSQPAMIAGSNGINSNFSRQIYTAPNFSSMPIRSISYAQPLSHPLQSGIGASQSGQSSNRGSRAGLWAGLFGGAAVAASMGYNTAYVDAQDEPVDVSGLLDLDSNLDSVDKILYPDLSQFLQRYSCSLDLNKRAEFIQATENYFQGLDQKQVMLYQNSQMYQRAGFFNKDGGKGRHRFSAVSGNLVPVAHETEFFIKGSEIDRVINAERLKAYLRRKGFDNFKVASECLHYTGQSVEILSPAIKLGNQDKKLSLQEVQQILQIAQDTGYWDWQFGRNLIRDHNNHLVFVDTEDLSFSCGKEMPSFIPNEIRRSKLQMLLTLFPTYTNSMDDEAIQWVEKQFDKFGLIEFLKLPQDNEPWELFQKRLQEKFDQLNQEIGFIEHLLPEDSRYDRGINFQKVQDQFEKYQQDQRLAKEEKQAKVQVGISQQNSLEEIE